MDIKHLLHGIACVIPSLHPPPSPNLEENSLSSAWRAACESQAREELVNCFSAQGKPSAPSRAVSLPESSPAEGDRPDFMECGVSLL